MVRKTSLLPMSPWLSLTTTQADWKKAPPKLLGTMISQLHIIRAFEEKVLELASEQLVHGPAHSSIGQEGGAVGSILGLLPGDQINGSHRGHHQFLSKALTYLHPVSSGGISPCKNFTTEIQDLLQKTLAEIMGLADGFCRGRGGSMHLRWAEAGALGTNAIVGGGAPMATGAAWSHKRAGTGHLSVNYFGDGAINIGSVLESMNLAAAWTLPICFFCENNLYAVSTHIEESTAETRLSARGLGFGIPSWRVDGMDPLAVHLAMQAAAKHMRAGLGPTLIEASCYRYYHQSGPLPGSAFGYRTKDEEVEWRKRDSLDLVGRHMIERCLIDKNQLNQLRIRAEDAMMRAADKLLEPDGNGRKIKPELWPDPGFRDVGLRGELAELSEMRTEEQTLFKGRIEPRKFVDVVADTMAAAMKRDKHIILLGEDIHRLKGGTNGATRGLKDAFPDRVLGTPISENAFMGLAGGMAMDGRYRPVVEFMYPDFMWVAADQVFNQVGKARHMFGGERAMPLVLRCKVAMGTGYGSQHSMDPAGIFATSPGWRIVAPSTAFDYVGLMNAALNCNDPVLVIEHVDLYGAQSPAPVDDFDYIIPLGKSNVVRNGSSVTVLTYLSMVEKCIQVADEMGIDAEVIDLRSLDRAGLDWDVIGTSIRKTNVVVIVEQGSLGTSYGGLLGDEIQRRYMDELDQPIWRVHGGEASPSVSKVLEQAAIAGTEDIRKIFHRVAFERGELSSL